MKMQPEITQRTRHWQVETKIGTCYVPDHVAPVPDALKTGAPIQTSGMDLLLTNGISAELGNYLPFPMKREDILSVEVVKGYCGRMSAPGYLDCTDWEFDTCKRRLERSLRNAYEGE